MNEDYSADKPKSEKDEDKFQRYDFSKRIADTIINRNSPESITIGLYGSWGEGKTTVLNFIRKELEPKPDSPHNIIHFTFNPWRFTDELSLLNSFFNTLANELTSSYGKDEKKQEANNVYNRAVQKTINWYKKKKGDLKTNKETIGEIIQNYSKALSVIPVLKLDEVGEVIGKGMVNNSIETLKQRVENLLKEHGKRIVIFIDDIDRLEKNEIHAIFRLVKLTGDFAYTTYILSFDENIVAAAIGDRFGTGDQKAGFSFLEKIVQVPIKLPLANKTALKNYCLTLIQEALDINQILLSVNEEQEFIRQFTASFLNRLTTPRLAVRYANTITFSLSLLKDEANYVDLLSIEAFRIFYPEIYDFVRSQPEYFIEEYRDYGYPHEPYKNKITKFNKLLEGCTANYSLDDTENVKEALIHLFPVVQEAFHGHGSRWGSETNESYYNEKRISTFQYFDRYFSYTVIEGDISDIIFNNIILNLREDEYIEKAEEFKTLIKTSTFENFIDKIRFKEKTFDNETSIALIKVFTQLGHYFSQNDLVIFRQSQFNQMAIVIARLIVNQVLPGERYSTIKWIVHNAIPIEFAWQIFVNILADNKNSARKTLSEQEEEELFNDFIKNVIVQSSDVPIWEKFPYYSYNILYFWAIKSDKLNLRKYIHEKLNADSNSVISLLRVYAGLIKSSAYPTPYYGDITKDSYAQLEQIADVNLIYEKTEKVLGISLVSIENYERLEEKQTDDNILRQFAYIYNKHKEISSQDSNDRST